MAEFRPRDLDARQAPPPVPRASCLDPWDSQVLDADILLLDLLPPPAVPLPLVRATSAPCMECIEGALGEVAKTPSKTAIEETPTSPCTLAAVMGSPRSRTSTTQDLASVSVISVDSEMGYASQCDLGWHSATPCKRRHHRAIERSCGGCLSKEATGRVRQAERRARNLLRGLARGQKFSAATWFEPAEKPFTSTGLRERGRRSVPYARGC